LALRGLRDRAMPTLRPQRECSCVRGEESSKARRAFQTRARPMDRDEARPPRAARRRRARRARAPLRRQEDSRLAERLPRCPDRHSDACEPSRRCPRHGEGRLRRVTAPPPKGARPQPPPQARELAGPTPPTLAPFRSPAWRTLQGGWNVKVLSRVGSFPPRFAAQALRARATGRAPAKRNIGCTRERPVRPSSGSPPRRTPARRAPRALRSVHIPCRKQAYGS